MGQLSQRLKDYAIIDEDGILSWDDVTSDEDLDTRQHQNTKSIEKTDFYELHSNEYLEFTNTNPTTFHAIDYFSKVLEGAGFVYLDDTKPIDKEMAAKIDNGGFFYTIRGGLTLFAFVIGGNWVPENGIGLAGAHVDVLGAKLKPNSTKPKVDGYELLGVVNYSGGLSPVWRDRDLGIGGGILVKEGGRVVRKLYQSPTPIGRIPTLAEHFGGNEVYNLETGMVPVVGFSSEDHDDIPQEILDSPLASDHSVNLLKYIVDTSGIDIKSIVDIDLELYDIHKGTRGGIHNEFMMTPRVDDRLCSFTQIYGIIEFSKRFGNLSISEYDGFGAVLLVDNEEIGSASRTGAKGNFTTATLQKILDIKTGLSSIVYANSLLLSADVTHALNPNFKEVYLENHSPLPNTGIATKFYADGHTATDKVGLRIMTDIVDSYGGKMQKFQIRNDTRSGSTIGPMLATETGSRVIDIGLPILSMHSIRAMCGYKEPGIGIEFFSNFFRVWGEVNEMYRGL